MKGTQHPLVQALKPGKISSPDQLPKYIEPPRILEMREKDMPNHFSKMQAGQKVSFKVSGAVDSIHMASDNNPAHMKIKIHKAELYDPVESHPEGLAASSSEKSPYTSQTPSMKRTEVKSR
jgi:hypothetical protein